MKLVKKKKEGLGEKKGSRQRGRMGRTYEDLRGGSLRLCVVVQALKKNSASA